MYSNQETGSNPDLELDCRGIRKEMSTFGLTRRTSKHANKAMVQF